MACFIHFVALGTANQFATSKHGQLIGWFNENFVHKGKIDAKYGKIINKAFNRRTKGDYDAYIEFGKEIVNEMFEEMKEFINEIKIKINHKE